MTLLQLSVQLLVKERTADSSCAFAIVGSFSLYLQAARIR
jgi:hypothetical protein